MTDRRRPPEQAPDDIYAGARETVNQFRFDEVVARVFPDMIRRSVPGYTTMIPMTGVIAARYAQPGTRLYDLGCSLGATTLAMRHAVNQPDCRIVAVDNSEAMIERCGHYIALDDGTLPVDLQQGDILDLQITNASVVTLNFTLQFIQPERRLELLKGIYRGLKPGGALVLSEKIRFDTPSEQSLQETLHHDFKRAHGYSDLEISQKRSALEKVLLPETLQTHHDRLHEAGFNTVVVWYQCFNFCSLLAIKSP